jgi:hypothetical protein
MKHDVGPKEAALKRQREARVSGRVRPAVKVPPAYVGPVRMTVSARKGRGVAAGSTAPVPKKTATPSARKGKRGPAPGPETVGMLVTLEPDQVRRIDEYRVRAGHSTRMAAIRALLEKGLK